MDPSGASQANACTERQFHLQGSKTRSLTPPAAAFGRHRQLQQAYLELPEKVSSHFEGPQQVGPPGAVGR